MRKLALSTVIVMNVMLVFAQDVSLPLGPFRDLLLSRYPSCFVNSNPQGELMLNSNCSAITTEDSLEFHNLFPTNFPVDLTGLQYFTSLIYLDCSNNVINNYVYPPNLKYLNCSNSLADAPFGSFPVFPASLETLIAKGNSASGTGIPLTPNLKYLDVSLNYMTSIPPLPTGLQTLICSGQGEPSAGRLTSLPNLPAGLQYLDCSNNEISNLPSLPSSLKTLICSLNRRWISPGDYEPVLSALPTLPASLEVLNCSLNKISSLPALPAGLKSLNCYGQRNFMGDIYGSPSNPNQLFSTGISVLPGLPEGLEVLICGRNNLTALPSRLPPTLKNLSCPENVYQFGTNMATDGIRCLPRLPSGLTSLTTSQTLINCFPNSGTYSSFPMRPLCNPVNNSNLCVSSPVVSGRLFYDNNSNGTKEAGENYRSDVRVNLSNGLEGYSNIDGYYELSADLGSYTLNISNPLSYQAVPSSINHSFSRYDTIVSDLVALQPTTLFDSIRINIVPVTAMRPGFNFSYRVYYENIGTVTVNPQLAVSFNNSVLNFLNASNPSVILSGATLELSLPSLTPGTRGQFNANFTVDPAAVLGDTVRASVEAIYGAGRSKDSTYSVITGSFDPNDKQATPSLTLQQVSSGQFIHYLVRFQNTGTDTAFNVVVTDTLEAKLNPSTFELLQTSHNCKTTRNGNQILFEFININLPDSNINEPASHGHVLFRIKANTNVPANSLIGNKANIYFDFNAPIITNTANTLIQLNPLPLRLLSFRGYVNVKLRKARLNWETEAEYQVSHFVLQRSDDGGRFVDIGRISAVGAGDHTYHYDDEMRRSDCYYRLRIHDLDGSFRFSDIIHLVAPLSMPSIVLGENPVSGMLRVYVVDDALTGIQAQVINSNGSVVMRFVCRSGLQEIPTSDIPDGTYWIRAANQTVRFIKLTR